MSFSVFEVLLIIGISHGFIISVIIWFRKSHEPNQLLLSGMLMVYNLVCIKIIIFTSGLWQTRWLRYFPLPFDLAIQPLVFLYVLSLTSPEFAFKKKHLLHFLPFALSLTFSGLVYFAVLAQQDIQSKDLTAGAYGFNQVKGAEDLLSVCSGLIYWSLSLQAIFRYRKWLTQHTFGRLFPAYEWLRNVIVLFGILFLMLVINIVLDYGFGYGSTHFIHWQVLFIYLAFLIYYMGLKGFQQLNSRISFAQQVPSERLFSIPVNINSATALVTVEVPFAEQMPQSQRRKVPPEEKSRAISEAIRQAFSQDRIHLDPDLNLEMLAKKVNVSPVVVSAVIHTELKKNFRNLVNEYRVAEVKERLADPRSGQLSLLGVAFECGFNSEASFYRIFKNEVGLSPKEYILQQERS